MNKGIVLHYLSMALLLSSALFVVPALVSLYYGEYYFLLIFLCVGAGMALAALPGALTVFIVSQRAASLQHADQILVLDDGHLVGIGTHSALRSSCPVYEEIYESQFKKGEAEA